MDPRESNDFLGDLKKQFNVVQVIAQIMSFPVEIWSIRPGTWGKRYLTAWALFGCFWPCLFGAFCRPHARIGDLWLFWLASFAWLFVHTIAGMVRRSRGHRCHSRFWGSSWFERGWGVKAQRRARFLNSAIAFGIGWIALQLGSVPLAMLLLLGSVAKFFTDALEFRAMDVRLQEMEDSRIENEFYAESIRERQQ